MADRQVDPILSPDGRLKKRSPLRSDAHLAEDRDSIEARGPSGYFLHEQTLG